MTPYNSKFSNVLSIPARLALGFLLLAAIAQPAAAQVCIDIKGLTLGLTGPSITVDKVQFRASTLPSGVVNDLIVDDNFAPGSNGNSEINVGWSEHNLGAANHAQIVFPAADFGPGPESVDVLGSHTNFLELHAYDRFGTLRASVIHSTGQNNWDNMNLSWVDGIRRIEIVGSEIGIEELCYDPHPSMSAVAGYADATPFPLGAKAPTFIDNRLIVQGAIQPPALDVCITDNLPSAAPDGIQEFFWGWSMPAASRMGRLYFNPIDFGDGPDHVEVLCAPSTTLDLHAYDKFGTLLATLSHTAGPLNLETIVFSGLGPVREIRLEGTQFWVQDACWEYSGGPGSLEYLDIAGLPSGLSGPMLTIDKTIWTAGVTPGGNVIDLVVDDNFAPGGNGVNEVNVPWTEIGAPLPARFAKIIFPASDFGKGPKMVDLLAAHTNFMEARAYDRFGILRDMVIHPGPQNQFVNLTLAWSDGIRRIDIIGSEIGIEQVCYEPCQIPPGSGYAGPTTLPLAMAAPLFVLNNVEFDGGLDPGGAPQNMVVTEQVTAPGDGIREFFYGWSMPAVGASRTARITFPAVHFGDGPEFVEVLCAPSTTLDLVAYDAFGNVVSSATHTAGALILEGLVLGAAGQKIREIELIGTQFWVQEVCWSGVAASTSTPEVALPNQIFEPMSPNPFNPRTVASFRLDTSMMARLDVLDARGRYVTTLVDGFLAQGTHQITWEGRDRRGSSVASGVYTFRLQAGDRVEVQRATLLK